MRTPPIGRVLSDGDHDEPYASTELRVAGRLGRSCRDSAPRWMGQGEGWSAPDPGADPRRRARPPMNKVTVRPNDSSLPAPTTPPNPLRRSGYTHVAAFVDASADEALGMRRIPCTVAAAVALSWAWAARSPRSAPPRRGPDPASEGRRGALPCRTG